MSKISAKNIQFYVVVAGKSFQFFSQSTWFLDNNGTLSKVLHGISGYLISIINLSRNQSLEPNFMLTTRATLTASKVLRDTAVELFLGFNTQVV